MFLSSNWTEMKMPWYSMYHGEGGGSRHRNNYQPSRYGSTTTGSGNGSNVIYHPIRLSTTSTTSSYSSPTYRQHSYYTAHTAHSHHVPPSGSTRRQSNSSYSSGSTNTTTSSSQYGLDGGSRHHQRHSSPSSGFGSFKSRSEWHHKRMDSATERLLARADALTDRLHRLLAKSADLHWRRTDHYVPRSDIFSRMSHATTTNGSTTTTAPVHPSSPAATTATSTASPPLATSTPSKLLPSQVVIDDDIRATNPDNVKRRASTPTPSSPPPPPLPPKVHVITIKLSNSCSNNHRPKPPIVHIIPIHIEKDPPVVDEDELDIIQDPDFDSPSFTPPSPPPVIHHIPIFPESSLVEEDASSAKIDLANSKTELEAVDCEPEPPIPVGEYLSTHESRRLALTLRSVPFCLLVSFSLLSFN